MRKGRWMATTTALLVIAALLVAAPAAARPKPPPEPEIETVTFTFQDGHDGLQGSLDMRVEAARSGAVTYWADNRNGSDPADLELRGFADFMPQGLHTGMKAVEPDECPDDPEPYRALAWLSFDRNGDLDGFIWHFDMIVSRTEGKKGCRVGVEERYNIRALGDRELVGDEQPLRFDGDTGVVSGTFNLHFYDADAPEPHVELARTHMEFKVTRSG